MTDREYKCLLSSNYKTIDTDVKIMTFEQFEKEYM